MLHVYRRVAADGSEDAQATAAMGLRWPGLAMAAAALGGYVLCGINTTRRGDGLVSDIVRSDCQLLLVDSDHAPLLDGLDLPGVTVLDVEERYYEAIGAIGPAVSGPDDLD